MYTVTSKMKDAEGVVHDTTLTFEDQDETVEYYIALKQSDNVLEATLSFVQVWMTFKRNPVNEGFKPASGNFYL